MSTIRVKFHTAAGLSSLILAALACKSEDDSPDPLGGAGTGGQAEAGRAGASSAAAGSAGTGLSGGAGSGGKAGAGALGGAGAGGSDGGAFASAGTGGVAGAAGRGPVAGSGGRAAAAGRSAGGGAGAAGTAGSAGATTDPGDHSPEGTCARWNADRADMSEGTWSGDVDSCDPGMISADGHDNALRLFNLYRWLADLPSVTTDPDLDRIAQACALLMEANGMLSHDPPMDWKCWTQDAYDGASSSNISTGPGVSTVDGYMLDTGNDDTLGHRRWILSNSLGPIGLGSTGTGSSCMQNLSGKGKAGKAWLAWPPPGAFPAQAVKPGRFGGSLDDTGWSIQSDSIDLGAGTVTITSGGEDLPVTVMELPGGYGSKYALSIKPDGWETAAGQTYSVSVAGTSTPVSYDIDVVDCPK